jgi:iron(III) transport system substrate-binding protein
MRDLLDPRFDANLIAIANPMFGTTMTQAAAVYAAWGPEEGRRFYTDLKARNIQVVDGNSVTKDMTAAGQVAIGYTDTDDAKEALSDGAPVEMVFPDQESGGLGTLICPNTSAVIKGAPHEKEAQQFIDYIISLEMEKRLIEEGFFDLSVRKDADVGGLNIKGMSVNLNEIYEQLGTAEADMREIFGSAR